MSIRQREVEAPDVRAAIGSAVGGEPERIEVVPLRGGLEGAVAGLRVGFRSVRGSRGTRWIVVKRVEGEGRREGALLEAAGRAGLAPQVLARADRSGTTWLLLEYIRPLSRWPWRKPEHAERVVREMARIHAMPREGLGAAEWNYEEQLRRSAAATLEVAEAHGGRDALGIRPALPALRRMVERLPAARAELARATGSVLIHGDAHPGNVMLRARRGEASAVFLDWGRARIGSPFEDLASWLQTLRFWEPNAARRHDSLLCAYLRPTASCRDLTRAFRDAYWIAGACNALAGALRYQIVRAVRTEGRPADEAIGQAREWLRIVRRGDAVLRA